MYCYVDTEIKIFSSTSVALIDNVTVNSVSILAPFNVQSRHTFSLTCQSWFNAS